MQLRGTKDFAVENDPANTTGPSGGCTTSSPVSLDEVMAKLNAMSTQMIGFSSKLDAMSTQMTWFSSILSGLQKDVNDLKTRFMGSSEGNGLAGEDRVEEQSMSDDSPAQP
jgi:hypothetical protein